MKPVPRRSPPRSGCGAGALGRVRIRGEFGWRSRGRSCTTATHWPVASYPGRRRSRSWSGALTRHASTAIRPVTEVVSIITGGF